MRTRRGHSYSVCASVANLEPVPKRARISLSHKDQHHGGGRDLILIEESANQSSLTESNPFEGLPEDLLICIFRCISASASSPSDLIGCKRTCKRFNSIASHPLVLAKVSAPALRVKALTWCNGSSEFLQQCADVGNIEACYTLGMIKFYCLGEREQGILLMSKAAKVLHPCALHSLAVIQFNGSGGARKHKNLRAGVSLCARAASLGHIDAMRELGHCLQDGYGINRNILEGRKLLLEANAREAAAAVTSNLSNITGQALQITATKIAIGCFQHHFLYQPSFNKLTDAQKAALDHHHDHHRHPLYKFLQSGGCSLLSDFGCNVPPPKLHIAHRFLVEWFAICPPPDGLRLCSHENCGRPETRRHEFRRCSACGSVNYCSRACQALDWKLRHKFACVMAVNWQNRHGQHMHGHGGANRVQAPFMIINQNDNQPQFNDDNDDEAEDF
ncbi:hypothetical protein GOP47_0030101 [Adiantum capillus-veneris]|nr:hypothetical protein GOP47_0030101 [Adiantum capillus-veneris]